MSTKAPNEVSSPPSSQATRSRIAAYLDHLRHERRLSGHTLSNYARDLDALLESNPALALEDFQPHVIRRSMATLHARGFAPASLARRLSAWRGFFDWLVRHHNFAVNPVAGIRAPRAPKRLPKALSPDGASQLFAAPVETLIDIRDRAMFELAYSSGLRLAELVSIDLEEGERVLRESEVKVTGKGNKTRIVPVGGPARAALGEWLKIRAGFARANEPALFVGVRGERVSRSVIQTRLKRWALRAGVAANVHPHVLRHSFATHVLQSSGDLRAVQEMLGHSNISTTQIYTQLDFQHLARVYDAAHPRARKKT